MNNRRLVVIGIGLFSLLMFGSMASLIVEFFSENYVEGWDLKLVVYLVFVGLGLVLTVTSLIMNKFFSHRLWLSGLIVMLFWGAKVLPVQLHNYQKVLIPMSYTELTRISQLNLDADDEEIIYLYRTGGAGNAEVRSKLVRYLRHVEIPVSSFNLTSLQRDHSQKQAVALTKRLGVTETPAVLFAYRGQDKKSKAYAVTFNGMTHDAAFNRMKIYLNDPTDTPSGKGIVYRVNR